ncbi:MAG: lipoprotein [Thiomicrospira sp.]|uniref:LPS translocon maturation chaperone LptM n=1 Tax=Thiomicrospira sp. TaxID=935 RepID=UPI001A0F1AA6|nr:lipoprotein [Thiomicrospira sp.]MBE0492762.1 lipoprotein [Thiomicrospira sp.]
MSLQFKPIWLVAGLLSATFVLSGCGKKGPLSLPQTSQVDTHVIGQHHSTQQPS